MKLAFFAIRTSTFKMVAKGEVVGRLGSAAKAALKQYIPRTTR